jgi:hypothetical protein
MSNYFFGRDRAELIGDQPSYFYGIKRNDDGEITLFRVNQLSRDDQININEVGVAENNYENFQTGVDFYEGRNVYHNILFENLAFEQYRWDDRSIYYYIDEDGQLVARTNTKYNYPNGISS